VVENTDMYYKLVIDRSDYTYQYYRYTGTTGDRIGESIDPIKFYERKGIPIPTPTPTQTTTPTPTPSPTTSSTPTPTPSPTPTSTDGIVLSAFYYSTVSGTYPVTSPGSAQLRIYNYTSDPKYIYLYGNSTYMTSGTLSGYATMDPGGANETSTSMSVTITGTNQISYGTNQSYLYIPAMTYYNFNIVHTSPSAGSFLFQYTDSTHPTKVNVPIQ
jgi:hypothetical protein